MLQTVRVEKVDEKRGRLSSMGTESHTRQNFVPESVNCLEKGIFYNFVQASAKI